MSHTTSYLAQHIVTSKLVFCENCKRVFETDIDSHINECPLCDVPNSMPEIPECVASELARRDEIITRLKEDAERLAGKLISMYADEMYECSYCGHGVSKSPDEIEHAPDCPITLHRALMKEIGG